MHTLNLSDLLSWPNKTHLFLINYWRKDRIWRHNLWITTIIFSSNNWRGHLKHFQTFYPVLNWLKMSENLKDCFPMEKQSLIWNRSSWIWDDLNALWIFIEPSSRQPKPSASADCTNKPSWIEPSGLLTKTIYNLMFVGPRYLHTSPKTARHYSAFKTECFNRSLAESRTNGRNSAKARH